MKIWVATLVFILVLSGYGARASLPVQQLEVSNVYRTANPDVFNDTIVWERDDPWHDRIIQSYDIRSNTKSIVTNQTRFYSNNLSCDLRGKARNPTALEDAIIWQDEIFYDWSQTIDGIVYLNLTNGQLSLVSNATEYSVNPDAYGDIIAWESGWDQKNITYHHISTNETIKIDRKYNQITPQVYQNYLVWNEYDGVPSVGWTRIYVKNLITSEIVQVGGDGVKSPSIYGDKIVYEHWVFPDDEGDELIRDIYMHNLTSGITIPICTDPGDQLIPKIYEDQIVWIDNNDGGYHIVSHNLQTDETLKVCTDPEFDRYHVDIHGNVVVWSGHNEDESRLFYSNLSWEPIPDPRIIETIDNGSITSEVIIGSLIVLGIIGLVGLWKQKS